MLLEGSAILTVINALFFKMAAKLLLMVQEDTELLLKQKVQYYNYSSCVIGPAQSLLGYMLYYAITIRLGTDFVGKRKTSLLGVRRLPSWWFVL